MTSVADSEPVKVRLPRVRGTVSEARRSDRAELGSGTVARNELRPAQATHRSLDSTLPSLSVGERAEHLWKAFQGIVVPVETQSRVARWLQTYQGPKPTIEGAAPILQATFAQEYGQIVFVKDIDFTALCEHHLLPFTGKAVVGYLAADGEGGKVVGLSKLARLVEYWTHAPTLQEEMTAGIINSLEAHLKPRGSVVVLYNVMHSCMSMRGIKDKHAATTTSIVRGYFRTDVNARAEFMSLLAL